MVYGRSADTVTTDQNEALSKNKPFYWNIGNGKEKSVSQKPTQYAKVLSLGFLIFSKNLDAPN